MVCIEDLMNVATFARAQLKYNVGSLAVIYNLSDWPQSLMSKLTEKLAASYKVMCERTQHVSQQPKSHFLSLLELVAVPSLALALPRRTTNELVPVGPKLARPCHGPRVTTQRMVATL